MSRQYHNIKKLAREVVKAIDADESDKLNDGSFTPSIYSGAKSATITVTGQSETIATGARKLQAVNKDVTNSAYVGFGLSAAEAEAACSTGIAGRTKFLLLADSTMLQNIGDYTHYAWLGVGGTVSMRITQGV